MGPVVWSACSCSFSGSCRHPPALLPSHPPPAAHSENQVSRPSPEPSRPGNYISRRKQAGRAGPRVPWGPATAPSAPRSLFHSLLPACISLLQFMSSQSRPGRGWRGGGGRPWNPEVVYEYVSPARHGCMPEVPVLRRQEDCCKFKTSLYYIARLLSQKTRCCLLASTLHPLEPLLSFF